MHQARRWGWISVFALLGCGGGGGSPGNVPPGSTSAATVTAQAESLYAAWQAGQDVEPAVRDVLAGFGIALVTSTGAAELTSRLAEGLPTMIDPQATELARAYDDGIFVSVDSFIDGIDERGATIEATGAPVTRAFLGELLASLDGKQVLSPRETLSALVLALGRARAALEATTPDDPIWGDGRLDPLQTTLLLFAVNYAGNDHLPTATTTTSALSLDQRASGVGNQAAGYLEGQVEDAVEIPITTDGAGKATLCASLLLYGHHMKVTAAPNLIWHKQSDGDAPASSMITARLTFEDDYWDNYAPIDRQLLNAAGCTLPRRGGVSDATVSWSLGDSLVPHGAFDVTATKTGDDGSALATFRTVAETTPKAGRVFANQHNITDAVIVQATGLVPGWKNLEWAVVNVRPVGTQGQGFLSVNWYEGTGWAGTISYTVSGASSDDKMFVISETTTTTHTTWMIQGAGSLQVAEDANFPGALAVSSSTGTWSESDTIEQHSVTITTRNNACNVDATSVGTSKIVGTADPLGPNAFEGFTLDGGVYHAVVQTLFGPLMGTSMSSTTGTSSAPCDTFVPSSMTSDLGGHFGNDQLTLDMPVDPAKPKTLKGRQSMTFTGVPDRVYDVSWDLSQP